jgi:hypothetical protein
VDVAVQREVAGLVVLLPVLFCVDGGRGGGLAWPEERDRPRQRERESESGFVFQGCGPGDAGPGGVGPRLVYET